MGSSSALASLGIGIQKLVAAMRERNSEALKKYRKDSEQSMKDGKSPPKKIIYLSTGQRNKSIKKAKESKIV